MKEAKDIINAINGANRIVITSHRGADGDSVGSSLGLYQFIKALGKESVICHPDAAPEFLEWVKGDVLIHDFESEPDFVTEQIKNADLIFSLDYNGIGRLGSEMGELLAGADAKKIMIDHHLEPEDFADIMVSEPSVCSTSQLVCEFIESSGRSDLLNAEIGTPLYLGIVTDTGSFRYSSVSPRTHEIISKMLSAGVEHTPVHENTFDNNRIDKMKLRAHIIAERLELIEDLGVALISVTEEELERFNAIKGDTEGLVNQALSIEGANVAIFLRPQGEVVKISFRSKGDIAVNIIARDEFDGGGHKNAAGGVYVGDIESAISAMKEALPKYFK